MHTMDQSSYFMLHNVKCGGYALIYTSHIFKSAYLSMQAHIDPSPLYAYVGFLC